MNHNQLIKQAKTAIQNGDKRHARALLQAALRQNPQSHVAWLWLASIAPSPEASLAYVKRAEILQPGHTAVLKARAWAEQQLATHQAQTATDTAPQQPTLPTKPVWQRGLIWSSVALLIVILFLSGWLLWQGGAVAETAVSQTNQANLITNSQLAAVSQPTPTMISQQQHRNQLGH